MINKEGKKIKTTSSEMNNFHYIFMFVTVFAAVLLATMVTGANNARLVTGESEIRAVDTFEDDNLNFCTSGAPPLNLTKTFYTKKSGKAIVIFSGEIASFSDSAYTLSLIIDGEVHSEGNVAGDGHLSWIFISKDMKPGKHVAEIRWAIDNCLGTSLRMVIFHA